MSIQGSARVNFEFEVGGNLSRAGGQPFSRFFESHSLLWFPSFSRGTSCILANTCCYSFPHSPPDVSLSSNGSPHREGERDGHRAAAAVRGQEGPHRARR